jgi:hypothetical protein
MAVSERPDLALMDTSLPVKDGMSPIAYRSGKNQLRSWKWHLLAQLTRECRIPGSWERSATLLAATGLLVSRPLLAEPRAISAMRLDDQRPRENAC